MINPMIEGPPSFESVHQRGVILSKPYTVVQQAYEPPGGWYAQKPLRPILFNNSKFFDNPNCESRWYNHGKGVLSQDMRTDLQKMLFLRDPDYFHAGVNRNGPGIMTLVITWPGYPPFKYPVISTSGLGIKHSQLLTQVIHAFDIWFREAEMRPVPVELKHSRFQIGPGRVHRDQLIIVGLSNLYGNHWQIMAEIDPRIEKV